MQTPKNMETNNIPKHTYIIEWVYGDKNIPIETLLLPNSNQVVINLHGTFWSIHGSNDKYLQFWEGLVQRKVANVVLYQTSRKNVPADPEITDRYKQKQAKFIWKTFQNELEDVRRVVTDIVWNSQKLFWVPSDELEITLNGNSLGGIIAFYLASEFPQIKNIVSAGTWLRLEIKDVPILDTFPHKDKLIAKLQAFQWKYLQFYGTQDDVFTLQSFFDLLEHVWSTQDDKSSVELIWCDHTFWKVDGETSTLPYSKVLDWVEMLLNQKLLVSWSSNLLNKVQTPVQQFKSHVDEALWARIGTPYNPDEDELHVW